MTVTISPRGTLFSLADVPIATEIRKYAGVEGDAVGAWVINGTTISQGTHIYNQLFWSIRPVRTA